MTASKKPGEFSGGPGMKGNRSASDRLRNTYRSGDPENPVPDEGAAFDGLLPTREQEAIQAAMAREDQP